MTGTIDLNADVGEEATSDGDDGALLDLVTSASVACGFHAGDPTVMRRTVSAALRRGVAIGAHPSYDDREGFGRRDVAVTSARLADDIVYQIGALDGIARSCGAKVRFVKPHGSLYNRMAVDFDYARVVVEAVLSYGGLVLLAPAGSEAVRAAQRIGVGVATEAFADRAYLGDGRLAPRHLPGAVIEDPDHAVEQALSLAVDGGVTSADGIWLELTADSLCLHSDTPGALVIARRVRDALVGAGFTLAPFVT